MEMSFTLKNRFALLFLAAPALLAARCDDRYASMGSDAGASSSGKDSADPNAKSGAGGRGAHEPGPPGGAHFGGNPSGGSSPDGMPAQPAGAGGADCTGWSDAPATDSVTVRIVNDTDAPLHFGEQEQNCVAGPYFELRDPAGVPLSPQSSGCITCDAAQRSIGGCPLICNAQPLLVIPPGESYDATWDARLFAYAEMPDACYFDRELTMQCEQATAAPSGEYVFSVEGWTDMRCENGGQPCGCMPNEDGTCQYSFGAFVSGESRRTSATLAYPAEHVVELRFE